ncbi:hypothetical protein PFHG_02615 [Plasmodium falciparum HB3]|uniref:Plasmodium RESA N-terminal domain-containing protein n=4 Tax=Plasmodium falciparum TaxID=5833 RepID=A0A024W771_PLAFA|nr:hypothetical protein PFFCH_01865 [Plasmodium falciparum FCH/4]ETW36360.1 hypothetical protein PFTANZ_02912 [Plasmodium falciparum Tanzania (2000708)]EUR71909.1 hypothetical protein PFBG_02935 [Plasmodium falciparum 7G8]KOB60832.1 hypothetical protein PFHG_02615 [Plasmodium falciparum HB3]
MKTKNKIQNKKKNGYNLVHWNIEKRRRMSFFLICTFFNLIFLVSLLVLYKETDTKGYNNYVQQKERKIKGRVLTEVILKNLEKYIEENYGNCVEERCYYLKEPKVNNPYECEEKKKCLREEFEKCEPCQNPKEEEKELGVDEGENKNNIRPFEVLTEEEFNKRINILRGGIFLYEVYGLWNYLNQREKRKYTTIKQELWKVCEDLSVKYNVPHECTMKEWKKVRKYMKEEFLKKKEEDEKDFQYFVEDNIYTRWEYIAFITDKKESWKVFRHMIKEKWKDMLLENFEKYMEEMFDKKMEKHRKKCKEVYKSREGL